MAFEFIVKDKFDSARVKCIDFHLEKPWILSAMIDGLVTIWNYEAHVLVKSLQVTLGNATTSSKIETIPVRTAKFIPWKSWIICGSDDKMIRVIDYETGLVVKEWEAHDDYIRSIDVHPAHLLVLSASDDKTVKLWDAESDFECIKTYAGHEHYVMSVKFDPLATTRFASASLDAAIKFWDVESPSPISSIDAAHSRGINCLEFYSTASGRFLVSGGDDFAVNVWDCVSNTCVKTLVGHEGNVSSVGYHAGLNMIFSAAEDGTVRAWNADTWEPLQPFSTEFERAWAIRSLPDAGYGIAAGYDAGAVVFTVVPKAPHTGIVDSISALPISSEVF